MKRLLLVGLALVLAAAPARAQSRDVQELRSVVDRIAAAWARGDAGGVVSRAVRSGVQVEVGGGPMGALSNRKAAAVIRRAFDDLETVSARTRTVEVTGGNPPRGYGEIEWVVRMPGSRVSERTRIFVALVRDDRDWRLTQIRLMR